MELAKKEAELEKKTKEAELERLKKEADAAREQAALERQLAEQEAERKREEEKKRLLAELEAARKVSEEQSKKPKEPETKPLKEEIKTNNAPRFEGNFVYYGKYPQSEVTDEKILNALKGKANRSGGWIIHNGHEYAEAKGKYFLVEPIKWRILKKENGEAYLLSDTLLDAHQFDRSGIEFNSSEIKKWLNGEFKETAFSKDDTHILTCDGDAVSLPTKDDMKNDAYGFNSYDDRLCRPTGFAKARGSFASQQNGCGYYWTKTSHPDSTDSVVYTVHDNGALGWYSVSLNYISVRPVIRIKAPAQHAEMPVGKKQEPMSVSPRFEGNYVYYGKYPQSEVTDAETILALQGKSAQSSGWISYNGNEYAEAKGKYFLVEPIKWRILKKEGDKAYLLSDVLLDCQIYHEYKNDFASSELRGWLNGEFKGVAFPDGGSRILPVDGDAVSLPTKDDLENESFGFGTSDGRLCKPTPFARARGSVAWNKNDCGAYWTKTPYSSSLDRVYAADSEGSVNWRYVYSYFDSVRPVIWIKVPGQHAEPLAEKKQESSDGATKFEEAYVYYGKYPQSEVKSRKIINALKGMSNPSGGWIAHDGSEYAEANGKYFLVEPIKWRVLKKENGEACLLSDVLLDARRFDPSGNVFSTSEIRGWLNGEFEEIAFPNKKPFVLSQDGDAVSLPTKEDMENGSFGFSSDEDRMCKPTSYAIARGSDVYAKNGCAYYYTETLHSSGSDRVFGVGSSGYVGWFFVYIAVGSVRPVIRIKASELPADSSAKKQEYPRFDGDFAFYGRYPQSEVTDKETLNALKGKPTNSNGWLSHNGDEYAEVKGKYYLVEPIRWRVLKKDNGKAKLLSDVLLDARRFDPTGIEFASSEIRGWLNGEFKNVAFPDGGLPIIKLDGDALSLPREEELSPGVNGIKTKADWLSKPTPYAKARGAWWLRQTGSGMYWTQTNKSTVPGYVRVFDGKAAFFWGHVEDNKASVRPILWVKVD